MSRLTKLHGCFLKMNGKQFRISKITKFEHRPRSFCLLDRHLPYCCTFEYNVPPRQIIQEDLYKHNVEKYNDYQQILATEEDVKKWEKIIKKVHSELDKEIISVEQSNENFIKELMG